MGSGERGMNPVTMDIFNFRKEYWLAGDRTSYESATLTTAMGLGKFDSEKVWLENNVRKGLKGGCQHLLFSTMFSIVSFSRELKSPDFQ